MSGNSDSTSGFDDWRSTDAGSGAAVSGKGGGGGNGGGKDKCAIFERTVLASPVSTVVSSLKPGDTLTVELETNPRNRVVVKDTSGQVAGAITSIRLVDIIECLQGNFSYAADVVSVSGGKIEVDIRPA